MKSSNEKILNLLILFIACILGIIASFLCITLSLDVLVWMLTGSFDLAKADILKTIKIGCVIGTFTGAFFVIARLFKLKGF
ncbi:hypothetical protein B6I74_06735 [Klebsiella variicola]|uniref:hypothetical protein n=1 Tax=Klebsiella variicola TaxID=244366 RepID=UPI000C7AC5D8|nr:hypothetical protein [Klebsiella variicola]PLE60898.1 hypothetical protein B6I74_06735 [Klebsiella variicola]